jgi:DNA-binding MurR/RpiR family transcriptional regulator
MDLTRAVELLSNRRKRIKCLGGRFSHHLAAILQIHLHQLHGKAILLSNERAQLFDDLVDIGSQDVLVVFDYRRYQTDIVDFCTQAKQRKAQVILFTDPYRSPIAAIADIVITTGVEVLSPYDTMTPALAVTEALVAGLTGKLADSSRERLAQLETFRDRNRITLAERSQK